MISFLGRDGQRRFAFDPNTDPPGVLLELSWAHPEGRPICGRCPMADGPDRRHRYCLDCHAVAAQARTALARQRAEESA